MGVKLRTLPKDVQATPATVVKHGWRDERYDGVDQCPKCHGWGTITAVIGTEKDRRTVHATCERCGGRGHT